ncbi:hypothetical protein [Jannaschia sp. R86511]|uniref:hypothetical protein n=1 Tax=Jannaschia sp. R86511 TaxID=3093853 RepID=UPI0036D2ECF8
MAVRFGEDAVTTVRTLMGRTTTRVQDLLRPDLPDEQVRAVPPEPDADGRWLWHGDGPGVLGGWSSPDSYDLVPDPQLRRLLLGTPPADLHLLPAAVQRDYVRRSVDLAMRGGATSGVVYPLAVCEIARDFRVRNVGGASAGAIAAAATAAAELGRSSGREGSSAAAPGGGEPAAPGHLRAGFTGLSDLLAWLLQLDPAGSAGSDEQEEFRLAQLFRPVRAQHDVFNVAVAVMRRRYWALPLAYGWAVGRGAKLVVLALTVLAAVALRGLLGCGDDGASRLCTGLGPAAGPVALLGFLVVASGLVVLLLLLLGLRGDQARARSVQATPALQVLADRASSRPPAEPVRANGVLAITVLVGAVVLLVAGLLTMPPVQWLLTAVVGLALVLLVLVVLVAAAVGWVRTARSRFYGLLSGSSPAQRPPRLSRLLGAPAVTVDRALVPWLADSLAELAGLPGTVLRFGHLWAGPDFEPVPESDDGSPTPAEDGVRRLAASPAARLVNLEMMTTDLSRGRPFRFPLAVAEPDDGPAGGSEALWFDPGDLCGELAVPGADGRRRGCDVLPREVVEAMTALTPSRTVWLADGSEKVRLHRLPHPWNLPVVLAVRISLALPVLFTAVRLYRLLPAGHVRDDLGRSVLHHDERVATQARESVAEPLWWSDGGITSNFPVHLFDSYLPRWPSFGLNLGAHPPGQPTQDVWLPQDWNVSLVPAGTFGGGFTGLLGAVLDSARNWRDTLQSGLPGFRSRVAAVRQHPSEGGVSLFMPRATVAALALRGAVAGARLRERFRDDAQWERHRWLRLRVTATSLEHLRARLVRARPLYDDLLDGGPAGLDRLAERLPGDPSLPPEPARFVPDERWWEHVADGLDALCVPPPDPTVTRGGPEPEPTLTQAPPT